MRTTTKALRGAFFTAFALSLVSPANATDRVTHYAQQNPSSQQFNLQQRYERLGLGQFILNAMGGNTAGFYSNITVTPSGGLYVQVAPTNTNTLGAVYQYLPDDTTPFGSGSLALSADPTQVYVQGLLSSPPIAIGPLTPPVATGSSIAYLIECQVQTVDRTPTAYNFVNTNNQVTQGTVNRDRADKVACQSKSGSPAVSPTVPTADAGWVSVASVSVASGSSTISGSNINAIAPFTGFLTPGTLIPVGSLPHGDYVDLTSLQTVSGTKTFSGGLNVTSNINGSGYAYLSGSSAYGAVGATVNGPMSVNGTGTFTSSVFANNGASGQIALGGPFSGTLPTVTNSADAGMNFNVGTGTSLGYRWFKASDATHFSQLAQLTTSGVFTSLAGLFGPGSFGAGAGQLAIGNDGVNSYLRSGTGNLYFQSGDGSTSYGYIGPNGLNVPGIYTTLGTASGNGVVQVPGSGILFLNYASGSEVQVGNGAGGPSGTHLYANGTIAANSISATSGTSTFGPLTINGGVTMGGNGIIGLSAIAGYNGFVQFQGNGVSGNGQIQLTDTTNTTSSAPSKELRANGVNGAFEVVNSAKNTVIFSVSDAGVVSSAAGGFVSSITSPDNSVSIATPSTGHITISSPPQVPPTHQFGGAGLNTGANGEVCTTVPYTVIGATANYGANTANLAVYIIEVDQQTSVFSSGTVCFRALTPAGATQSGVGLYYNITTTNTLHA